MSERETLLDDAEIRRILPHRYPFLLLDRILELTPGEHIRALKNVTVNEPFFQGHFPERAVMPGVLVIEAMAQAGGVLAHQSNPDADPRPLFYLVGIDNARFRRSVHPGDRLEIDMQVDRVLRGMWRFEGRAIVADITVATAVIMTAPGGARR